MKRELIAKTSTDKKQALAKIDCGAEEFEIQLMKQDVNLKEVLEFCNWLIKEKGKTVKTIHIHLLGRGQSIESIEHLLENAVPNGKELADLSFSTANYCSEIQGFSVGLVLHKFKATLRDNREVEYYKQMLSKHPNVTLFIENSMSYQKNKGDSFIAEPSRMFFEYVQHVKDSLPEYSNRIWALVDTNHLMGDLRLHKKLEKIGIDLEIVSINEILKNHTNLIKAVHLSYGLGSAHSTTHKSLIKKHGVAFKGDSSAQLMLLNLVFCIENYLKEDVIVILEIEEENYCRPINYFELRNMYYEIQNNILNKDVILDEHRKFPRLEVDVVSKFNNTESEIRDISINTDEKNNSFFTLRVDTLNKLLRIGDKTVIAVDDEEFEVEIMKTNSNGYVVKSYNVNTLKYVDKYLGFDDFVFEKIL